MGFNIFNSKKTEPVKYDYKFHKVFNEVSAFFQEQYSKDVEDAKKEFVNLTGTFDEEHEYFEAKLDDFRSWFLFFYGGTLFSNLEKIKKYPKVAPYYDYLTTGVFSIFLVQKIKGDDVFLKDLLDSSVYKVRDAVAALSMEKGGCVQTSLYYVDDSTYRFGMSLVVHPLESLKYIKKKVKEVKKGKDFSKEKLFEQLLQMRYQFFKYKQLEVDQIYSDKPLVSEKTNES